MPTSYIARLLDGGVTDADELYLVMEYIDGETVTHFCKRHGLTLDDRLRLFMKICEAVQYAHRNLIVHRDLKPENILVAENSTPRLLDFGTAKIIKPLSGGGTGDATRSDLRTFTPRYASPEQVLDRPISIASDIYSLGVLLYVLLTDRQPYELANFSTEELVRVICGEQPRRPSATPSPFGKIDADLDSIVLKALRKEPQERYSTAENLAADIQAYLDHRPVEARRGNLSYHAGKFVRRNRFALAAASLLLATAVAGTAGVLWQSHIANQQRRKADERTTELRQLSTSLLAEIDSTVKDLAGSTPVRRLLVARVLEHLDELAKEAGDDPVLALEMVNAYTRLGNLEGNPYGANIGDTAGALKSLDKALSFAPALHVATTRDPAALQAFGFAEQSRSEVLYALGRDAESAVALQAGLRAFDTLLRALTLRLTRSRRLLERITPWVTSETAAAIPIRTIRPVRSQPTAMTFLSLVRALKMQPNHARSRRAEALIRAKIGMALTSVDPVGAVAELRQSIALREALPDDLRLLATNQQGEAFSYRELGDGLTEARDYRGALNAWDQALGRNRALASADPKDTSGIFWVATDLMGKGLVYQQMLDANLYPERNEDSLHRRLGIDALHEALNLFDRLIAVDPKNPTWISFQTQTEVALGTLQFGTPEAGQGARLAASALKTMRKASDSPDAPLLLLAPAVTDSLSVLPVTLRDPVWTLKAAQRLNERTHNKTPTYLLALARRTAPMATLTTRSRPPPRACLC